MSLIVGYAALALAILCAGISHSPRSYFICLYLLAYELNWQFLAQAVFPTFIIVGVYIDWAFIVMLTRMRYSRSRFSLFCLLASLAYGYASILDGRYTPEHTPIFDIYGIVMAVIAMLIALDSLRSTRGRIRKFKYTENLRNAGYAAGNFLRGHSSAAARRRHAPGLARTKQ